MRVENISPVGPVNVIEHLRRETVEALDAELGRALQKFPGGRDLLAALVEEVGELARALLEREPWERITGEAIQVATVAIRIVQEGCPEFTNKTKGLPFGWSMSEDDDGTWSICREGPVIELEGIATREEAIAHAVTMEKGLELTYRYTTPMLDSLDENLLVSRFLDKCCVFGPASRESCDALWEAFLNWQPWHVAPLTRSVFMDFLDSFGYRRMMYTNDRLGLSLRADWAEVQHAAD